MKNNKKWTENELHIMYIECSARDENDEYYNLSKRIYKTLATHKQVRFSLYEKDLLSYALENYPEIEKKLYNK
jgi:hypothetical protein